MQSVQINRAIHAIQSAAHPIVDAPGDYDPLLARIGDAQLVLLGEATHGTHEFYHARAEITKRLIAECGFTAIAVEADWPHAERVDRFVHGAAGIADGDDALSGFHHFPAWMWRNTVVRDFIGWLHEYNASLAWEQSRVGFYGLDLYSLSTSMESVIGYLDTVDPAAAARARDRYACFDIFGEDSQRYGHDTAFGISRSCEDAVVAQLIAVQRQRLRYLGRDGRVAEEAFFSAEQNARVVRDAERYYRTMYRGNVSSWNLRDRHMAETLDALVAHGDRSGIRTKIVVWAHNSHLGDARATEMHHHGEWNVGQLVRERYGRDTVLVGFTTYAGEVTAASDWGGPAERKRVRPAHANSYEALFHEAGIERFLLLSHDPALAGLTAPLLGRAIGVIYRPETERRSHYFTTRLAEQFDAVLHLDTTTAVTPLERTSEWEVGEAPETFPFAV